MDLRLQFAIIVISNVFWHGVFTRLIDQRLWRPLTQPLLGRCPLFLSQVKHDIKVRWFYFHCVYCADTENFVWEIGLTVLIYINATQQRMTLIPSRRSNPNRSPSTASISTTTFVLSSIRRLTLVTPLPVILFPSTFSTSVVCPLGGTQTKLLTGDRVHPESINASRITTLMHTCITGRLVFIFPGVRVALTPCPRLRFPF